MALDEGLQPIGHDRRNPRAGGGLRQAGGQRQFRPAAAGVAKIIVALFTRPSQKDGAPVVRLPLSIQNRTLSAAQFELFELPIIRW